jgi:hypothetical protein
MDVDQYVWILTRISAIVVQLQQGTHFPPPQIALRKERLKGEIIGGTKKFRGVSPDCRVKNFPRMFT